MTKSRALDSEPEPKSSSDDSAIIRGHLGVVREDCVLGWAMFADPELVEQTVRVAIYVNDHRRVVVSADQHRPDLQTKGISKTGLGGFRWQLPSDSKLSPGDRVRARAVNTSRDLVGSPARVPERPLAAPVLDRDSGEATLIFVHVPKTAGTTIRQILMRQYPNVASRAFVYPEDVLAADWVRDVDALADLDSERKSGLQCVAGHFHFGVHRRLDGPSKYIALLRHPLERVISLYHHVMTFHRAEPIALRDWVAMNQQARDHQCRILAGAGKGADRSELVARAVKNIDEHFALVGLTERFDESILLIAEKLGWAPPHYVRDNVSTGRPKVDELTSEDIDAVVEANQLDVDIYEHVERRLNETIDGRGDAFTEALRRFRAKNHAVSERFRPLARWRVPHKADKSDKA